MSPDRLPEHKTKKPSSFKKKAFSSYSILKMVGKQGFVALQSLPELLRSSSLLSGHTFRFALLAAPFSVAPGEAPFQIPLYLAL